VELKVVDPPIAKRPYNPKAHKTFYHVGTGVLQIMLNHTGPKTVRDLVHLSDGAFAQSTVRQTCKGLVKDGLLSQVEEYPASFAIADETNVKAFIQQNLS